MCRKFELIPIKIGFFTNLLSCSKIGSKSLYYSTGSWAKFHQKWKGKNSPFLLHFLIHVHVLMLCRKFELIPIKIGFFTNFLSCSKIGSKSLYYSTGSWAKFHQKWKGENSPFLLHFLIHVHVLMLCIKFELIPIKIEFFTNFFKLLKNRVKVPVLVQGLRPNFIKNEKKRIHHFYYIFWYIYMYLCCVESLSWFRSKLDFLRIFLSCSKIGSKSLYYSTGSSAKFHQKWKEENSPFLLHFLMHVHVLMLCIKFELILIKIGFFTNFLSCSKIGSKSLYSSTGSSAKFHQKWKEENSPFLLHFLIHIHVLMLCRKFELIPIKIGFFTNFFKLLKNRVKVPVL